MSTETHRIPKQRLREERILRGWSQKYVAEQIGAERYYISRWERGIVSPSSYYSEKLCILFNMNTRELEIFPDNHAAHHTNGRLVPFSKEPPAPTPAPSYWYVPHRRNPFFTGREKILDVLYHHLSPENNTGSRLPLALSGLGGIGKTELALEYAYLYRNCYQAVFWLQADTPETFALSICALAELLNLSEKCELDYNRTLASVRNWLSLFTNWLLILDNIEDIPLIGQILPFASHGHVLLTTRNWATGPFADPMSLPTLSHEEGVLLLLKRARLSYPDTINKFADSPAYNAAHAIVEMMGALPLALNQAGAYINITKCSLTDFLNLFHRYSIQLLDSHTIHENYPLSVVHTFQAAYKKIEQRNPLAIELLRICAFLGPDPIPVAMLVENADVFERPLRDALLHPLALNEALAALHNCSLLYRDPEKNTLTVHCLVQTVLRETLDRQTQHLYAERTVCLLNQAFPEARVGIDTSFYPFYLSHMRACVTLIEQWRFVSPTATQLLKKADKFSQQALDLPSSDDFFTTCCEFHPRAWSVAGDLWRAYQTWVHSTGERFPLNHRMFIQMLKQRGCLPDRTKNHRLWRGIALRPHITIA